MASDDSSMIEEFSIMEKNFIPFFKEKSLLLASMMEGKNVLEVGCGTGDLIQFFKHYNITLLGSDYSDVYSKDQL